MQNKRKPGAGNLKIVKSEADNFQPVNKLLYLQLGLPHSVQANLAFRWFQRELA